MRPVVNTPPPLLFAVLMLACCSNPKCNGFELLDLIDTSVTNMERTTAATTYALNLSAETTKKTFHGTNATITTWREYSNSNASISVACSVQAANPVEHVVRVRIEVAKLDRENVRVLNDLIERFQTPEKVIAAHRVRPDVDLRNDFGYRKMVFGEAFNFSTQYIFEDGKLMRIEHSIGTVP